MCKTPTRARCGKDLACYGCDNLEYTLVSQHNFLLYTSLIILVHVFLGHARISTGVNFNKFRCQRCYPCLCIALQIVEQPHSVKLLSTLSCSERTFSHCSHQFTLVKFGSPVDEKLKVKDKSFTGSL